MRIQVKRQERLIWLEIMDRKILPIRDPSLGLKNAYAQDDNVSYYLLYSSTISCSFTGS